MVAITSSSARENLLSMLGAGAKSEETSANSVATKGGDKSGSTPATIVDLSDRAKAMLERNKADQLVADFLREQKAAGSKTSGAPKNKSATSLLETAPATLMRDGFKSADFKTIEAQQRRMLNGEQLQLGQENMSAEEAFTDGAMRATVNMMLTLESSGKTAEAADLRAALANGTVNVQRASEVADLNLVYKHEKIPYGESSSMNWGRATGEAKALIDSNHAMTFATPGQGAFFISW